MESELIQAWHMSNEVNLFLLDKLPDAWLEDRYADRTRTVGAQFAHIHNVRLMWTEHSTPKGENVPAKFPRGAQPGKDKLLSALEASAQAVASYLSKCEASGKVTDWNGPPSTLLGYFIAHEAHHRGLAMAAIRMSGHRLPDEVVYGMWQWGMKRKLR